MSDGCNPSKPTSGSGSACADGSHSCGTADLGPADETKTTANRIDIVFDSGKSKKVTKCEKIVHVQFMRYTADDTVTTGAKYSSAFSFKDDSVTSSDGWTVDCLAGETTPDYQQGTGNGSKNGGTSNATMMDAPRTAGGDKGFYNAASNPSGWKKVRYEFATYAWCMKGTDCGKWYEGITWEYVKGWEDQRDGKDGVSTMTNKNVASGPTSGQLDAFKKFNSKHSFTPCT